MENPNSYIVLLIVEQQLGDSEGFKKFESSLAERQWVETGVVTNSWTKAFSMLEKEDVELDVLSDISEALTESATVNLPYAYQIGESKVVLGII
ncbi:hypothetical protein EHQ61_04765 [Leptospira wolffii]|uniref:hypothetical protein n=1 Tax=Leptospira wolffii TaxID=409998 RepID=UPI00108294A0|nr:hypothetical protein [Leptospira wolffii]TGL53179.1 hypothetical protein EHQ61_04765 [Leptospira wolffii]